MIDYLVIVGYFVALLGAGYLGLRWARSAEDFVVAGRRLGWSVPVFVDSRSGCQLGDFSVS